VEGIAEDLVVVEGAEGMVVVVVAAAELNTILTSVFGFHIGLRIGANGALILVGGSRPLD
jgi:hypothetical protein